VLLPFKGEAPTLKLDERPVQGDEGQVASALHIVLSIDGDEWQDGWFHARGVAARSWAIGELSFHGRWLHWRCSADGRIVRAVSHAGATLRGPAGSVRLLIEASA